jgi:probable F420-dependent oxidoreductase
MSSPQAAASPWRDRLGPVGVWVFSRAIQQDPGGFAKHVEGLGYRTLWVGGGHRDESAFDLLGETLAATDDLVVATGIVNIWAWEPAALARRAARLEAGYRGRFVLGLGVSHAPLVADLGRHYERPFEAMVAFLDALDAEGPGAADHGPPAPPRVLAALGRRMIALSRDRSAGAHPYLTPPEHTRLARKVLGDAPVLAPEQALVLDEEPGRARATARAYLESYLRLPNYRRNLERLGYDAADLNGEGSDRLVDAIVSHGSPTEITSRVLSHLEAGADHVCVQPLARGGGIDLEALEVLGPALLAL